MSRNLPTSHSKYILQQAFEPSLSDFKHMIFLLCLVHCLWCQTQGLVLVHFLLSDVTWSKSLDLLILLKSLLFKMELINVIFTDFYESLEN